MLNGCHGDMPVQRAIYCKSLIFSLLQKMEICQHEKMFQFFYKWSKYFQLVQERDVRIGIVASAQ